MFGVLLKKQLLESWLTFSVPGKKLKKKKKASDTGTIILFLFLLACLGFSFYGMADSLAPLFFGQENEGVYFAMIGMIALSLGVLVSAFSTYQSIYKAKDNELLLSMPIPSFMIIACRIAGVYAVNLVFMGMVFFPALIRYWIFDVSFAKVLFPLFVFLFLVLLGTVLASVIGWIIALIAKRTRHKSIVTVVLSLTLIVVYYYFYFRYMSALEGAVLTAAPIASFIKGKLYPIYIFGLACLGDLLSLLIWTLGNALIFATFLWIMSKNFYSLVNDNTGVKKVAYDENQIRSSSAHMALLKREGKRFVGSSVYLMNCGLGVIFMVAASIFLLVKSTAVKGFVDELSAAMGMGDLPMMIISISFVCLMISTNIISAPSISLEGKNLWILRSLPVSTEEIFFSKRMFHVLVNVVPSALLMLCLSYVLEFDITATLLLCLICVIYCYLTADMGLFFGLRHVNLNWTNEAVPVKRGMAVLLAMLSGWVISFLIIFGGDFVMKYISLQTYLFMLLVLFVVLDLLLRLWFNKKGHSLFEEL